MSKTENEQWWHDDLSPLASQLSKGILNEMKQRILKSNIQKEKLTLNESTQRMKIFFERELTRYKNRKESLKQNNTQKAQVEKYKLMLQKLMKCNIELSIKCQKNKIQIEKTTIQGQISCWH